MYEDPSPDDEYVFEIIDFRIPSKYKDDAKNRDYSGFINIYNPDAEPWSTDASKNSYKIEAIKEYLQEAYDKEW